MNKVILTHKKSLQRFLHQGSPVRSWSRNRICAELTLGSPGTSAVTSSSTIYWAPLPLLQHIPKNNQARQPLPRQQSQKQAPHASAAIQDYASFVTQALLLEMDYLQ